MPTGTERGYAVRHGLHSGEGGASARERAQDEQDDGGLAQALGLHGEVRAGGDGGFEPGLAAGGAGGTGAAAWRDAASISVANMGESPVGCVPATINMAQLNGR